jgi:heptosyltransferase-2/heptosyltransferase-3
MSEPKQILLVKTHAIGDVLMTTPAIRAVHHQYPRARLSYLVGRWSEPAVKDNPYLRGIIALDDADLFEKRLLRLAKLVWQLRGEQFDRAYIFQPASEVHRLMQLAGIPERIGFYHQESSHTLTLGVPWRTDDRRYGPDRFLDLVRATGGNPDRSGLHLDFTITQAAVDEAYRILGDHPKPWIALCPGGGVNPRQSVPEKRWQADRWAELASRIHSSLGIPILLGSGGDYYVARDIAMNCEQVIAEGVGRLSLAASAEVIHHSALCITHDTATMHLAVAVNTPTVVLFGPTDPGSLLPDNPKFLAVFHQVECRPCYWHGIFPGCTDPRCLDRLGVDEVWEAVTTHWGTQVSHS